MIAAGRYTEASIKNNANMNGNLVQNDKLKTPQPTFNSNRLPHLIWVIGGPGSNKATLCLKAVGVNPGWGHIR